MTIEPVASDDEWPDEFGPYLEEAMRNEEFAAAYLRAKHEPPSAERTGVEEPRTPKGIVQP